MKCSVQCLKAECMTTLCLVLVNRFQVCREHNILYPYTPLPYLYTVETDKKTITVPLKEKEKLLIQEMSLEHTSVVFSIYKCPPN